ncbi:Reticulon-like protein B17 [Camellia lanceoleosa]|uniref:Reticulon-like protein B17 n=1 Tax=Camellia lanceoleosa TaxID=1840588 RepID=A0ACC0H020_9ERIC|nr:Reticulon-like protein B17 [Camellia lanceoleosa]
MDSTPPSHRSEPRIRIKSASRLARLTHFDRKIEDTPRLSVDLVPCSQKITTPSLPSPRPENPLPMHELLLLSPSPLRRSKTRLVEKLDMAEEPVEPNGLRRRCKNRNGSMGLLGCASPRNGRRSRRRLEPEIREERDLGMVEEMGKVKKRRHSGRSKKDKLSLVPSVPSPKTNDDDLYNLDRIGQLITDLILWNDVAKSTLWFGFGSLCFLSSCFARGISFSIFSFISQLGLLFLGLSFFSNSICQRGNVENKRTYKLKEDDILRAARVILPTANLAISKTRDIFRGTNHDPQRFFISFTGPKLYSCYSVQINSKVDCLKRSVLETWGACSHKKIVAASAATAFWNLTAIRTRLFAAFIFVVLLRHYRQHSQAKVSEEGEAEGEQEQKQEQEQQALVVVMGEL